MPIAWHYERWWNFHKSEDEKKEIEPIFTGGCKSVRLQFTIWKYQDILPHKIMPDDLTQLDIFLV